MEIIYEDDSVIVCYKQAGLPTQTKSVAQEDLEGQLIKYRVSKGEKAEIFVIHRLDQPVEGLVVMAKTKDAAAKLSSQVQDHSFKKKYFAIVTGPVKQAEAELTDYLAKDSKTNMARISSEKDKNAKIAKLKYKSLNAIENRTLFDIELYTGRHHQIRAQLSNMGNPILGDAKYGGEKTGNNLCLCSYYLSFKHPKNKKIVEYSITPKGEAFQPFFSK